MPNLAVALKEEIRRLARKEIKSQVGTTKKMVAQYRREIAALKRQLADQQKQIKQLAGQQHSRPSAQPSMNGHADKLRFSAKSVKAQRDRLGFSAKDYARLLGVSMLSIYNWEQGKARPQKAQLAALSSLRGIGKREALAKLAHSNGKK